MAITSELVGKLGGADVKAIPVSVTATGGKDSEEVLTTINVPPGETWLVVVYGNLDNKIDNGYSSSRLYIGDTLLHERSISGINSLAHIGTGTIEVGLRRSVAGGSDSFTGHVYAVKV